MRKNLYFSDSFHVKPNYKHYKEDSTRRIIVHEFAALGDTQKERIVQIAVFSIIFVTGI